MKLYKQILITLCLLLVSCAPYVNYQPKELPRKAKPNEYNITIYHELDPLPKNSSIIEKKLRKGKASCLEAK